MLRRTKVRKLWLILLLASAVDLLRLISLVLVFHQIQAKRRTARRRNLKKRIPKKKTPKRRIVRKAREVRAN
jgi:hypothetical protein